MKRTLVVLLALASPALAEDDNLPQFPKIAAPSPLPDPACDGVSQPLTWGMGEWISPTLHIHVDKLDWSISGSASHTGKTIQLDACSLSLSNDSTTLFEGVRAADGQLYGAYWPEHGKVQRLTLRRP